MLALGRDSGCWREREKGKRGGEARTADTGEESVRISHKIVVRLRRWGDTRAEEARKRRWLTRS